MSRMTLEEAIQHCRKVAEGACTRCAEQHRQLAGWLEELKQHRAAMSHGERLGPQVNAPIGDEQ